MTAEPDALLAAVLQDPEDDAPRLIFADWLDEHGQPDRAAFIRLQVERARLPKYDPLREVLGRQADRLFDLHGADWLARLPDAEGVAWGEFDRGFPRAVVARSMTAFERAAGRLAAAAPIDTLELRGEEARRRLGRLRTHPALRVLRVRHLGLTDRLHEFLDSPLLATLHTLDLSGLGLENWGMTLLARAGALERLRELVLDENMIGSAGLEALAGSRYLRDLTRLSVRGGGADEYSDDPVIRSDGVQALATSHVFANLEALDLSGNEVEDEAVAYLVEAPHLVNLKELNLANNGLTAGGLEVLEDAGWEVRLEALDLSFNALEDAGARRLAESEVLNSLVRLGLERCEIGPDGADDLARADWFPGLRGLNLNDNQIGAGVRALAAAGHGLAELRVRGNDLASAGARAIAGAAALGELVVLDVGRNGIGAGGLRALGASPHLARLAVLDASDNGLPREAGEVEPAVQALAARAPTLLCLILDGNILGVPGLLALAEIEWPRLCELGVRRCSVNVPALAYLASDGRFRALNRLGLGGNQMSPPGIKVLLRAPFVGGLTHLDLADNHLGNDGVRMLAEADLPRLRWLSLDGNNVRQAGFTALVQAKGLPRLSTVRFHGNAPGDWWQLIRDRFLGDEVWTTDGPDPDEDIPF